MDSSVVPKMKPDDHKAKEEDEEEDDLEAQQQQQQQQHSSSSSSSDKKNDDVDMICVKKYRHSTPQRKEYTLMETFVLAFQTLGVVYGDLGTSPLYVLPSLGLTSDATQEDFLGVLSLIIWTLTFIPLIKYVFIVLQADDHGEGGTFALYSYICRHIDFKSKLTIQTTKLVSDANMSFYSQRKKSPSKTRLFFERSKSAQSLLTFVVLLGTSMVIGDGALTPAISVLSALAGIQTLTSKITTGHVVFIAVVLLLGLFYFQSFGTTKVGFTFSPIMTVWFVSNAIIGVYNIAKHNPGVLKALSPHYIVIFFLKQGKTGWKLLGAVFLCTTGGEAMFADLGHFNKQSIQLAFTLLVYPSLLVSYAGEVAYLSKHPENISTAFYSAVPKPVYWPMFVVSTLAAVVASQSLISAAFSIVKQSLALGCFPRVTIKQTCSKHEGQIFIPEVNFIIMVICITLVLTFKEGVEIGNAYGVVVVWVMIITTGLVTLVMLIIWDTNIFVILAFAIPYLLVEGAFMTALMTKIPQGGWVSFAIAAFFLAIMLSWLSGRIKKTAYDVERKMSLMELESILMEEEGVHRTPGICFFCTDLVNGIPPIVRHYLKNTHSLREVMVIVTIRTLPIKTVLDEERYDVGNLGIDGVYRCLIQYGYKDVQSMKEEQVVNVIVEKLMGIVEKEEERERLKRGKEKGVVFVAGRTILKSKETNGLIDHIVINYMYRFLQKNSRSAFSTLQVPPEKFLQVGMQYEI